MATFNNEEMVKRMLEIAELHGLSRRAVSLKLGMAANAMGDWAKGAGKPSVEVVDRFSKLFRVSVGYLMYGDDGEKAVPQTQPEKELLSVFRALPYDRKDMVMTYAKGVARIGKNPS